MNTLQLNKILFRITDNFVGSFASDQCPNARIRPFGVIMNTDSSREQGEHWVALWVEEEGIGDYFDSFGFPPLLPNLQKYVNKMCPNGFGYNNTTIQHPSSSACGLFCVAFIISKVLKTKFDTFLNKYSFDLSKNDEILKNELEPWITKPMKKELNKINLMI